MLLDILAKSGTLLEPDSYKKFSSPTGFTIIDILNGEIDYSYNGYSIVNGGFTNKFYTSTGESSSGKTTLAIQMMAGSTEWWNKKYPKNDGSDFIMIDAEDNIELSRVMELTNWDVKYMQKHFRLIKEVSIIKIFNIIRAIADEKEKNKEKYMVNSDILDINGNPLKTWITTYILIDSVASLKSNTELEDFERDKEGYLKSQDMISGNIEAMRESKNNTDFIMKIKPILNKYGIMLLSVNHLVQENQMSMFDVLKKYLPTLKPGQRTKGGKELIYASYCISMLEPKEKLNEKNPIYGDDVYGSISNFTYIKSKTSEEGIPYRLIFDAHTGYRPELSDFEYLYQKQYGFDGSVKFNLNILPEVSFTRKTLYNLCKENQIFRRALKFTAKIGLIYNIILKQNAPKLDKIKDLSYEKRVFLILKYTDDYPGYNCNLTDDEIKLLITGNNTFNNHNNKDLTQSFLEAWMLNLLLKDEDGLSFQPNLYIEQFINKDDYIHEKDKDTDFMIPKRILFKEWC